MMSVATVVMVVSAFLNPEVRTLAWLAVVIGIFVVSGLISMVGRGIDPAVTASMVERFGLFTIIVLGEVVVGVVDGLSEAERDPRTLAIGVFSLTIGFGFWWSCFDFTGRRPPRSEQPGFGYWLIAHFPVTAAIAAAGAGMVDLIAHADDDRTSTATAG